MISGGSGRDWRFGSDGSKRQLQPASLGSRTKNSSNNSAWALMLLADASERSDSSSSRSVSRQLGSQPDDRHAARGERA
jgi:hypothetical protein